jgi:hypothetical protein
MDVRRSGIVAIRLRAEFLRPDLFLRVFVQGAVPLNVRGCVALRAVH